MESEAAAVPGYVNRSVGHAPERRDRLATAGHDDGQRTSMRIALVALRAYEQRSERRARLHAWLIARTATDHR